MTLLPHTEAPAIVNKLERILGIIFPRSSSPAQYHEADRRLFRLEEELHFLIQCSRLISNQRAKFAEKHLDSSGNVNVLKGEQATIDEYLALVKKGRKLDEEIKRLKEKCSSARYECNFHFAFQHGPVRASNDGRFAPSLKSWLRLNALDHHGVMEKEAIVEPIVDTVSRVINVTAAVGAVGAGVAYTTLFSATRGRLDLIAWSYMCFITVVHACACLQGIQRSRRTMVKTLTSMSVQFLIKHAFNALFVIVILLTVGTALLAVSVVLLNPSSEATVVGSRTATNVAGYLTLGWPCSLLAFGWIAANNREGPAVTDQPASPPMTADEQKRKNIKNPWPSHILPAESKWDYLPGEKGYSEYRQRRRSFILNPPEQEASETPAVPMAPPV